MFQGVERRLRLAGAAALQGEVEHTAERAGYLVPLS
jgi:hypothetical protein